MAVPITAPCTSFLFSGDRAFEDLGGHAQLLQFFDRGGKRLLADLRANVAVLHEVDRALGVRAVGRRAALEITRAPRPSELPRPAVTPSMTERK